MLVHTSTARNYSETTENRIHSDDVAAGFGFGRRPRSGRCRLRPHDLSARCVARRGLVVPVPGEREAPPPRLRRATNSSSATPRAAISTRCCAMRLQRPACRVAYQSTRTGRHRPDCSRRRRVRKAGDRLAERLRRRTLSPRGIGRRDAIERTPNPPPKSTTTTPATGPASSIRTRSSVPRTARFTRRYFLPAWLHVGSEIRFHKLLHVGDTVEVRTVPTAKWGAQGA